MTRIALIQPLETQDTPDYLRDTGATHHIGVSVLSYAFKNKGYDVLVVEGNDAKMSKKVARFEPDIIGVTVWGHGISQATKAIVSLKKKNISAKYVVGGPQVTYNSEDVLRKTNADFAVIGGGINPLQKIIKEEYDSQGIAYFSGENFVSHGFSDYETNDWRIDVTTFPIVSKGNYFVINSVGCSYGKCDFCQLREMFPKVKIRPLENVIDDMKDLVTHKAASSFFFGDDNLLATPKRLLKIDELMTSEGLDQKISFLGRADSIIKNQKYIEKIKDRTIEIHFGAESFSDSFLKRLNKGANAEQNVEAVEILRKNGIFPQLYMMMADEKTTIDELGEFTEFFKKNKDYLLIVGMLNLKGEYFEDAEKYPDHIKTFHYMFRILCELENVRSKNSRKAFLNKEPITKDRQKFIDNWLDSSLNIAEKIEKGKINSEEFLKKFGNDFYGFLNSKKK